jgi:hypothetical protein
VYRQFTWVETRTEVGHKENKIIDIKFRGRTRHLKHIETRKIVFFLLLKYES